MNQALRDIRSKVARANHHFADFKAEFGLGPRASTGRVYPSGVHYERGWTHIELKTDFPAIQRDVSLVLGDAIRQMRSALDHLASCLVFQKTSDRKAMRKAQFPLFHDPNEFRTARSVKFLTKTFGDSTDVFRAIRTAQPFRRDPKAPRADPLWILSELDNIDKHRTMLVLYNRISVTGVAYSKSGHYRSPFQFRKRPVKTGTQTMTFARSHSDPPETVDMSKVSPYVVLDETGGLCDDLSIFPLFGRIRKAVTETIASFARFFV